MGFAYQDKQMHLKQMYRWFFFHMKFCIHQTILEEQKYGWQRGWSRVKKQDLFHILKSFNKKKKVSEKRLSL